MAAGILQWVLGILLLPVAAGYSVAFYRVLIGIHRAEAPALSVLLGVTAYLAVHAFLGIPNRLYVFGHELTHALAVWISGGAVKGFKVSEKGGQVKTNRITPFIALAPYLIPIYTVLAALAYGAVGLFRDVRPWLGWFLFAVGFTLTFHLVLTVHVLKEKQSDLDVVGPLLSLGIIYWGNITLIAAVLSWVIPEIGFMGYFRGGWEQTVFLCQTVFRQLFG